MATGSPAFDSRSVLTDLKSGAVMVAVRMANRVDGGSNARHSVAGGQTMMSSGPTARPFHRAAAGTASGTMNAHRSAGTRRRRTTAVFWDPNCATTGDDDRIVVQRAQKYFD